MTVSRFEGVTCLVTGAAQGIGEAIAKRFASEGAKVLVADLNLAGAEALAADVGNGSVGYQIDVSSSDAVRQLFDTIVAEHGVPDVVVNNAGISSDNPSVDLPDTVWQASWT
jgi:NAD(P)-dependent dehydrogenase (short-subunit alcohol dehydrogenase family)